METLKWLIISMLFWQRVIDAPLWKIVIIELTEYYTNCGDGCCTYYGTVTKVNGKELECHNQDVGTIVKGILEELGYNAEVIETYN